MIRVRDKPLHYLRLGSVLVAALLVVLGLATSLGDLFAHADAVGGVIAGAGGGVLLTELTSVKDRAKAAAEARSLTQALTRLQAAAVFARFRTAAELGAVATQSLMGSDSPSPDLVSRFTELCQALDLGTSFAVKLPPAGVDRELQGYDLYKQIKQALVDRHGESVSTAFAFVYVGGLITGGSGSVDPVLAGKLRDTLFDLPEEWLKEDVNRLSHQWEEGRVTTAELAQQLNDVYFWLMNYGSRRPEILGIECQIRRRATGRPSGLLQSQHSEAIPAAMPSNRLGQAARAGDPPRSQRPDGQPVATSPP